MLICYGETISAGILGFTSFVLPVFVSAHTGFDSFAV